MKRIGAIFGLLATGMIYLLWRIARPELYLADISVTARNPVSFHWWYVQIDTGFIQQSSKSLYTISLIPMYGLVGLAILVMIFPVKKINSKTFDEQVKLNKAGCNDDRKGNT